jgi:ribose 5-phosphate isomerase B
MPQSVAVAADHGGFDLKTLLVPELSALGLTVIDLGTTSGAAVDYPDFASAVVKTIAAGDAQFGLLICGTGIGMSIAANRHKAVRAALCHDGLTARLARQHNDANILVLGGRLIGLEAAKDCLKIFFSTPFDGGRHAARIAKLS